MASLTEIQVELDLLLKSENYIKIPSGEESAKIEAKILHLLQKELPVVAFRLEHMGISKLCEVITTSADCINGDVFALEEFKLQTLIDNHQKDLLTALQSKSIPELIVIAKANTDKYCTPVLEQYLLEKMSAKFTEFPVNKIEILEKGKEKLIYCAGKGWAYTTTISDFPVDFEKFLQDILMLLPEQGAKEVQPKSEIKVLTVSAELNALAIEANSFDWEQNIAKLSALERKMFEQLSLLAPVNQIKLGILCGKKNSANCT